jgi:hypothetical protein
MVAIATTIGIAFVLKIFNVEINKLCRIIRSKPFESFVVVGICIVIAILIL